MTKIILKRILRILLNKHLLDSTKLLLNDLKNYYRIINSRDGILKRNFTLYIFPFIKIGIFKLKNSENFSMPRKHWRTLSYILDVVSMGIMPKWQQNDLLLKVNSNVTILTSAIDSSIAVTLKESFIEDEYKINGLNINGKVVLDIGANIGDTAITFAVKGAKVIAFEPVSSSYNYLVKNIKINKLDSNIKTYNVGLSDRNQTIPIYVKTYASACASSHIHSIDKCKYRKGLILDNMQLVDAVPFFKKNGIRKVDILKMDCEHEEYVLLKDSVLLDYLRPEIIMFEFHDGIEPLISVLNKCGYFIESQDFEKKVGIAFAKRSDLKKID